MTADPVTNDLLADIDPRPRLPARTDRGIGIVGAGAIVNAAHLPAYRKAGFNVVGITDIDPVAAKGTAQRHGLRVVFESVDALLDDPAVEIVDLAVRPDAQLDVVRRATAMGKHVLCQKPLAEDFGDALEIVELGRHAQVRIAVNQQMRWDQLIRSNKLLLADGFFGEPTGALFDVDIFTDWGSWPWMAKRPQLEYFYHSIHYLDSIRFLFGEPLSVSASTATFPDQVARGESRSWTILDYGPQCKVAVVVNHNNWSTQPRAIVRLDGTEARSEGTLGLLYDYPHGRPDTLEVTVRSPERHQTRRFSTSWVPDAFIGPMADLQLALEEDREPETSAVDNLDTLRIVHAAYRSDVEGRRVRPGEVGDDR